MSDEKNSIPKLGATGQFPKGQLNPDDEGGLQLVIGRDKGCVIIDFGESVSWLGLPPDEADQFADHIKRHAATIRKGA